MKDGRGIVIAGGGTGGHVVPSLQIARALVERGHPPESIELFGSRRGQEATLWPTLEFPFTLLPGRGLRRSFRPRALWTNIGAVAGLLWAVLRAVVSFAGRRPHAVVVVGGYASFAAGLAAVVTRVPLVVVHIDAVPGAASGFLVRFAAVNAVAFPDTDLPRSKVTGTPVPPELGSLDRSAEGRREARKALGLPADRVTVAAFGGSLGARRINEAVAQLAHQWVGRDDLSMLHVTGRRDYDAFHAARADGARESGGTGLHYETVAYEDRMPDLYRAADVCVCRSGAMTVAELVVAGVPAVLVPLPGAPRDHQARNARALVAAGAAILLPDDECNAERLGTELTALLGDPARLRAMSDAARGLGHADAAARVAALVDSHAR